MTSSTMPEPVGTERDAAECFPVSSFVVEEMEERGWTRERLAEMAGWSHAALTLLLDQDSPLTVEQAADLERVFGASQTFWLDLETSYRRWNQRSYRERANARRHHRPAPEATE